MTVVPGSLSSQRSIFVRTPSTNFPAAELLRNAPSVSVRPKALGSFACGTRKLRVVA